MALDVGAILALSSGVPLVILGGLLIGVQPRRGPTVLFALFAVCWGMQIVLSNLGRVFDDPGIIRTALPIGLAMWPPAYLFLIHSTQRITNLDWLRPVTAAAGITAALGIGALALTPDNVITVTRFGNITVTSLGPANTAFFLVPFYTCLFLATFAFYQAYRTRPAGTPRHRMRTLLLGLLVIVAYVAPRNLLLLIDLASVGLAFTANNGLGFAGLIFGLGTAMVLGIAIHVALRPPPPQEPDNAIIVAIAIPFLAAIVETILRNNGIQLDSSGIWRVLFAIILAYGLARDRVFDLDLRLRPFAVPVAALCIATVGLLIGLLHLFGDPTPLNVLGAPTLGVAISAVTFLRRDQITARLFPPPGSDETFRHQRRLDLYRAELERRTTAGAPLDTNDPDLARIRQSLSISAREHQALAFMVERTAARRIQPARQPQPNVAPANGHPLAADAKARPTEPVFVAPGQTLQGRYRIERLIGEGAHGRAFRAFDQKQETDVVVKVVSTHHLGGKAADALRREARIMKRIQHANVLRVHDVLDNGAEVLVVMDHAAGGSIQQHLARRGPYPIREATRTFAEILDGLQAAHDAGVIHRDVKPENILLDEGGHARLADFGIARETSAEATGLTMGAVGTLLFMAPEQVRGTQVDPRTDVYAACIVFHLLLTGRYYLPLAGKDDFQVRRMILEEPPHVQTNLPSWVQNLLLSGLAKDPNDRPASAADLRRLLPDATP